jgi:hypothetical protein
MTGATSARRRRWSNALGALVGTASGLLPHLLHHVGLLAGAAVLAGATGTVLFGLLGLAAMLPLLLRLRRRFASWWAPAVALGVFAAMFVISAVVLGPALRSPAEPPADHPSPPGPSAEHTRHHAHSRTDLGGSWPPLATTSLQDRGRERRYERLTR